jgi:hypothetical protein
MKILCKLRLFNREDKETRYDGYVSRYAYLDIEDYFYGKSISIDEAIYFPECQGRGDEVVKAIINTHQKRFDFELSMSLNIVNCVTPVLSVSKYIIKEE